MRKTIKVRSNKDGTVTVKVGRSVEHFSADKSRAELFDCIKYSILSKGASMDDVTLVEILQSIGH